MHFSRPSQQLPTPPETDTDLLVGGHHAIDLMNASGIHAADPDVHPHPFVGAPSRRISTLAYHNSPLRDPRERPNLRQSRWLIIVIPPTSLVEDHGPLGQTLTSGPAQRLSQGIVMPLQPTMYGQLNAIAREFNFPSPVGLCLYLHVTEHGFTTTPRISDEIWPGLWGHLFEARSPTSLSQMPICGRIEFDIDRRKARWFDSWLTSDRRHTADVPVSVPPSLSHWREDSKNSFFDERGDERPEVLSGLRTESRGRHIPKKLSLVDKLEALSVTSSMAGNGAVHALSASLATILQEGEPKTAKIALEKRVESWRASSSVTPTPMATTGQVGLDSVPIPNNMQLSDIDILADIDGMDGIDLNDFAWSVSSMGPPDYQSLASAVSRSHASSVHLDRRLEGSVLLTPSTATSWGPETLDNSPMSTLLRLPSPDLGQRIIEDCPLTPSTATSWGPDELLYSPASVKYRLPSPDLGQRVTEDSPPTPSTATSWGPDELLYSPVSVTFRLPSPDLGQRVLEDCPPTPTTVASRGPEEPITSPISMVSRLPSLKFSKRIPGIWPYTSPMLTAWGSHITKSDTSGTSDAAGLYPSSHGFPYVSAPSRLTWTFAWPFIEVENAYEALQSQFPNQTLAVETYDAARLHFKIFPERIHTTWESAGSDRFGPFGGRSATLLNTSDHASLDEHHGYVYDAQSHLETTSVYLESSYPASTLYPLVYPYLSIHFPPPAELGIKQGAGLSLIHESYGHLDLGTQYPYFNLYPAGYPTDLIYIYPPVVQSRSITSRPDLLPSIYPTVELYPAQYPFIMPYPPRTPPSFTEVDQTLGNAEPSNDFQAQSVDLNRLGSVAPLYPAFDIYPTVAKPSEVKGISLHLPQVYPKIILYPAVYPELDLYPPAFAEETAGIPMIELTPQYPRIRTYPVVYPWFEIYPDNVSAGENDVTTSRIASLLPLNYPQLAIYPAAYPYFDIYRTGSPRKEDQRVPLLVMLPAQYPAVDPYPPTYPHFEIFPPVTLAHLYPASKRRLTPVGERIPSSRRVRRTHKVLHEEVFGAGSPVKESVEQAMDRPLGGTQVRGRTRSGTINTNLATPQTTTSSPSSLPPVPPLPMSKRPSLRMVEARHGGLPMHPPEARSLPTDRPASSHITLGTHSPSFRHRESITRSNSLTSANSGPRRDHGHSKQSHRPRDSLLLEKTRHFDQSHTLPYDDRTSSVVNEPGHLPVPPVPQLPFEVPPPQKFNHTKHPLA
ncbi:hypothetical protein BJV74DRAFT_317557 [Russula compacta]|nr:hypothetical protein BJV74DRAFT_317557 [Russula compacta]